MQIWSRIGVAGLSFCLCWKCFKKVIFGALLTAKPAVTEFFRLLKSSFREQISWSYFHITSGRRISAFGTNRWLRWLITSFVSICAQMWSGKVIGNSSGLLLKQSSMISIIKQSLQNIRTPWRLYAALRLIRFAHWFDPPHLLSDARLLILKGIFSFSFSTLCDAFELFELKQDGQNGRIFVSGTQRTAI